MLVKKSNQLSLNRKIQNGKLLPILKMIKIDFIKDTMRILLELNDFFVQQIAGF